MNPELTQDIPLFGGTGASDATALDRIKKLVALLQQQAARVELCKTELDAAKAAHMRTEREDLPELLRELGIESLVLDDGSSVTVKDQVSASITEANRPAAHAWLRERGFGGLIKSAVVVSFPAGSEGEALGLASRLAEETDKDVLVNEAVHPQTLTAFVRERMEAGEEVPTELFGVFPFSVAKVTAPRAPRTRK